MDKSIIFFFKINYVITQSFSTISVIRHNLAR